MEALSSDGPSLPNTHIWCDNCEAIKPLMTDEMSGRDVRGEFEKPTDLICGECRLVIATTYSPPATHGETSKEGK